MKLNFLKAIPVLAILLVGSISVNAQSMSEEVDMIQSIYGMEKKALIAEFLGDSVNSEFWSIYDEYETERKSLGKDRLNLITDYVTNYSSIDGEVADGMVKRSEQLNSKLTGLISKYTKKIRKVTDSKVAAQFYQIENYLLGVTRLQIMNNIPFLGELKMN
jgi:hypothetical protein